MAILTSLEMLVYIIIIKVCYNDIYFFTFHIIIMQCGNPINPGQEGKNMSYTCCYDCGVPIGGRDLRQNTKTKLDSRFSHTLFTGSKLYYDIL